MNLFVISTPTQAFFLSKMPKLLDGQNILLITENKRGAAKKICSDLQQFNWQQIIIVDTIEIEVKKNFYKIFAFLIRVKFSNLKKNLINKIYIGSYDNFFHLGVVAMFEKSSEIYLLYDGLQMLAVANNRKNQNTDLIRPYSIVFKLAGFQKPTLKKLTYISPFNFPLPPQDDVIKIEAIKFKNPTIDKNLIYIVGQPLVDLGIITIEDFEKTLINIKKEYSYSKIEYIPHPKESDKLRSIIQNYFPILNLQETFEEYYITSDTFAGTIISFYSSVIVNMNFLSYPSTIISYKINKNQILRQSNIVNIEYIYSYFQSIENQHFLVKKMWE